MAKRKKWVKAESNTQRAALKLEKRLITEIDQGKYNPGCKDQTLRQFSEHYMNLIVNPHKAPGTINAYKYAINTFNRTLGDIFLTKLTPVQIQSWCNTEMQRVKPTTARDYYNVLNIMLQQAVRWQQLSANPCAGVMPPKYNRPNSNAYSKEETAKILDIMQDHDIYIFILLGALCGLRSGEMAGLRWSAVNITEKKPLLKSNLSDILSSVLTELLQSLPLHPQKRMPATVSRYQI